MRAAALIMTFTVCIMALADPTPAPAESSGDCCYNPYVGCVSWPPIFGPCEVPCECSYAPPPDPAPASGYITWRPELANYTESPWLVKLEDGTVYLGGHAGWCCVMPADDGHDSDRWWVIRYKGNSSAATTYFVGQPGLYDDHEIGGLSALRLNGTWVLSASRTERAYWGSTGNRLRPFLVTLEDFFSGIIAIDRTPMFLPADPACAEMGSCVGIGAGQLGSLVTTADGRVLLLAKDDVGFMRQTSLFAVYEVDLQSRTAVMLYETDWGLDPERPGQKFAPSFGDWARADDGSYYAYTGDRSAWTWYEQTMVVEWNSVDEGRTWQRTGRTWDDGVTDQCLWDVAVLKNEDGTLAYPLTFAANASPGCGWAADGVWRLWWWTQDWTGLPSSLTGYAERPPRRRLWPLSSPGL